VFVLLGLYKQRERINILFIDNDDVLFELDY